ANYADSGTYYRVVVGTTASNLEDEDCAYNDDSRTMVRVITCGEILDTRFVRFGGTLREKYAVLNWATDGENQLAYYEVEKSSDGVNYTSIGQVYAKNLPQASYHFSDPQEIYTHHHYRLKMVNESGLYKYSSVVLLKPEKGFELMGLENPFQQH